MSCSSASPREPRHRCLSTAEVSTLVELLTAVLSALDPPHSSPVPSRGRASYVSPTPRRPQACFYCGDLRHATDIPSGNRKASCNSVPRRVSEPNLRARIADSEYLRQFIAAAGSTSHAAVGADAPSFPSSPTPSTSLLAENIQIVPTPPSGTSSEPIELAETSLASPSDVSATLNDSCATTARIAALEVELSLLRASVSRHQPTQHSEMLPVDVVSPALAACDDVFRDATGSGDALRVPPRAVPAWPMSTHSSSIAPAFAWLASCAPLATATPPRNAEPRAFSDLDLLPSELGPHKYPGLKVARLAFGP
ncbi:hypothetical protein C8R46DRAFT_1044809 [Mycena filopes]|nr:hypothetical protein C8R46DRAFT_1044809 [Mycena filopes]